MQSSNQGELPTKTPETDKEAGPMNFPMEGDWVHADFARFLETQRDEARRQEQLQREGCDNNHAALAEAQIQNADLTRQLAETKRDRSTMETRHGEVLTELATLRRQSSAQQGRVGELEKALTASIGLNDQALEKLDMLCGDSDRDPETFRAIFAESIEGLRIVRFRSPATN